MFDGGFSLWFCDACLLGLMMVFFDSVMVVLLDFEMDLFFSLLIDGLLFFGLINDTLLNKSWA